MRSLVQYINESKGNITKLVDKAIEDMANNVMDNIDYEFLSNATDFETCKDNYIVCVLNLVANNKHLAQRLSSESFSINDIFKKYKHVNALSVIDTYVEDSWQDDLDEDIVDALNDLFDTAGVVNKIMLNGGRFESFRDFQIAIEHNVINKIRKSIKS